MEAEERYRALVLLNGAPGAWHRQDNYGKAFYAQARELTNTDLCGMLQGRYWIGTRAPDNARTDRIILDVDCKSAAGLAHRDRMYGIIRGVFGRDRVPLLYGTPSGYGFRAVYRIPETDLAQITRTPTTGLVADALRGAGVEVRLGGVEVYPQVNRIDRLVLGPLMPFLDPGTLARDEPGAADGERRIELGLVRIEEWHRRVHDDLLPLLHSLPRVRPTDTVGELVGHDEELSVADVIRIGTRLLAIGLEQPSTRFDSEFTVAMAFALNRDGYPQFGLPRNASNEDIARATARWLAVRHNGFSKEWNAVALRGPERAVDWWTNRYMAVGPAGSTMIDRAVQAVRRIAARQRRSSLTADERLILMSIAEAAFDAGVRRYRFEVWAAAFLRAVRSIVAYQVRRGREVELTEAGDGVIVRVAAAWMEQWPYGGGSVAGGTRSYVTYRDALIESGLIAWAAPYVHQRYALRRHGLPPDAALPPNLATAYRVPLPDGGMPAATLSAQDLNAVARIARSYGGPMSLDEIAHAVFLRMCGMDLAERYGRRTRDRIHALIGTLPPAR